MRKKVKEVEEDREEIKNVSAELHFIPYINVIKWQKKSFCFILYSNKKCDRVRFCSYKIMQFTFHSFLASKLLIIMHIHMRLIQWRHHLRCVFILFLRSFCCNKSKRNLIYLMRLDVYDDCKWEN